MQLAFGGGLDLTYCTNIHPGNGWPGVFNQIKKYAPELKGRLCPNSPFALGLRLSDGESREIDFDAFAEFLAANGLYVALINGFPYGSFHRTVVKEDVFAPDWTDERRLEYTLRLARIVNHLLPHGLDGGVSTIPLSYKPWVKNGAAERIAAQLVRAADELARMEEQTGRYVHIDIEPEPNGMVENSAEAISFFDRYLSSERARRYLTICFDTCHMAVEYEDVRSALTAFQKNHIGIGRVQISSALQLQQSHAAELRPFVESTYLHQVIARCSQGRFRHYPDLADALDARADRDCEWRVHFHVPIFLERFGALGSTQNHIRETLDAVRARGVTKHLEIETYTWEVLPPELREDLVDSIAREFEWVLGVMNNGS